jgi:hypothetical protein
LIVQSSRGGGFWARRAAVLIMIALGIGGATLNAHIFRLLGVGTPLAMVMSLASGFALLGLGHIIGAHIAQNVRRAMDWFVVAASLLAAVGRSQEALCQKNALPFRAPPPFRQNPSSSPLKNSAIPA